MAIVPPKTNIHSQNQAGRLPSVLTGYNYKTSRKKVLCAVKKCGILVFAFPANSDNSYIFVHYKLTIVVYIKGHSSVGRAVVSKTIGRGFKSFCPCQENSSNRLLLQRLWLFFLLSIFLPDCMPPYEKVHLFKHMRT